MSAFWARKVKTFFNVFDLDKDGVISENDFVSMGRVFSDYEGAPKDKKDELVGHFTKVFRKVKKSEKNWTVQGFVDSLRQLRYDPDLIMEFNGLIRGLFDMMDVNRDGFLQVDEHKRLFDHHGFPPGHFNTKVAFDAIDVNKDGKLSIEEYVQAFFDFLFSEDETSPNKYYFGPLVN